MLQSDLHMEWDSKTVTLHYPVDECNRLPWCLDTYELSLLEHFFNQQSNIVSIDWDGAMTDVVCYISFKYSTSDEKIKQVCEDALNMIKDIIQRRDV